MIEEGRIHYKQFDKVEEIPQLRHLRKFPHKDTMLSKQVITNTIMNQINRADRRTSKLKYLLEAMRKDITSRLRNGYDKRLVAQCVLRYQRYTKNKGKLAIVLLRVRRMFSKVLKRFD